MSVFNTISKELQLHANPEKGEFLQRFFKTGPGQYGEGDIFIGLSVPVLRSIAKKFYKDAGFTDIRELLYNPIHEYRLASLFILVLKFSKTRDEKERKSIVDFYLKNAKQVNNWDLVDSSADKILGAFLYDKDRSILQQLAKSKNLWEQRISIMATFHFIKLGDFGDTLVIAEKLLSHKHDLIHKAVGWMLREIGKRNFELEYEFLIKNYQQMPRTMLRYAIEKFDWDLRQKFLQGIL